VNDSHIAEELLHRYFDGELNSSRARAVSLHLATCSGCAARHVSLCALRQAICESARDSAQSVDFEALFARIESGLHEGESAALPKRASAFRHSQTWQRKRRIWVVSATLLAAAAALLVTAVGERIDFPPAQSQSAEIEQVDFGDHSGTLFTIALADGAYSNVVWIDDDVEDFQDGNHYDDPDDSEPMME
jgi:anti-sigma factor RsiW